MRKNTELTAHTTAKNTGVIAMGIRPTQTRSGSAIEAATNVAVGFLLAFVLQGLLYPVVGIATTPQTNLLIAAVFTAVSVLRSYLVRRAFEQLGRR
jgi:hypothetical protein